MMAAIFGTMFLALLLGWALPGRPLPALTAALACLALALWLFQWEIYSPDYGFRMPWIQTWMQQASAPA